MVVIRLARSGAKKRPFYHIVAADSRRPVGGSYIERLGYFNPIACGKEVSCHMKFERIQYWLAQGAQPSQRIKHLLKSYLKSQDLNTALADTSAA